jgi:eight-cysteine-cluster-containing protein
MFKKIIGVIILILILIMVLFFYQNGSEESRDIELGFCGWATETACGSDNDCVRAGGAEEVCSHVDEAHLMVTTSNIACYNPEPYGVECGCFDNMCQWQ